MRRNQFRVSLMVVLLMVFLCAGLLFASGGKEAGGAAESEPETAAPTQKYKEAPMLAAKVAKGELPPVDERLPDEPLVVVPIEKVGRHGGTVNVAAVNEMVWQDFQYGTGMQEALYRINKNATNIAMNVARDYELSEDYKSFTIYLREGLKWSDGEPFTTDDIVFWFEDIVDMNVDWELLKGQLLEIVKIDDYTVRLDFAEPYAVVVAMMAGWESWRVYQPKHYLAKWHPKYNEDAEALAKEEGFESWQQCILTHYNHVNDLDVPDLNPWLTKDLSTTSKLFERNPYYWKVDTAGNQLPYIDRVNVSIVSPETYTLRAISGESDYAFINTSFSDFTLYKENESAGGYRTVLLPGGNGSDVSIALNQNYEDPVLRELFGDIRFRRALSVAIDREEMNDVVFYGKAVPRQATVLPSVSYYKKEWGEANAQYDPDLANALLDEIGITERNKDGFRLRPDGQDLIIVVEYSDTRDLVQSSLELIKEYWQAVGINVMVKYIEYSVHQQRAAASKHMALSGWTAGCDELANYNLGQAWFASQQSGVNYAFHWDNWINGRGAVQRIEEMIKGTEDAEKKAELEKDLKAAQDTLVELSKKIPDGDSPPQHYIQFQDWFTARKATLLGSPEYMELSEELFDYVAEKLYIIGTVGMVPRIIVAQNKLRNIETPENTARGISPFDTTAQYHQYFLEE